jgi:hypothetical protein
MLIGPDGAGVLATGGGWGVGAPATTTVPTLAVSLAGVGGVAFGVVLTGLGGCFAGRGTGLEATRAAGADRRRSRARLESAFPVRRDPDGEGARVESSRAGRPVVASELEDGLAAGRRASGAGAGAGADRQATKSKTLAMPKCP